MTRQSAAGANFPEGKSNVTPAFVNFDLVSRWPKNIQISEEDRNGSFSVVLMGFDAHSVIVAISAQ